MQAVIEDEQESASIVGKRQHYPVPSALLVCAPFILVIADEHAELQLTNSRRSRQKHFSRERERAHAAGATEIVQGTTVAGNDGGINGSHARKSAQPAGRIGVCWWARFYGSLNPFMQQRSGPRLTSALHACTLAIH